MLHELRIENLLLIDRAELRLAPGLNVVTGETGAGEYARLRSIAERASELREVASGRERELDLLAFELEEIERVWPSEDEARELADERERLRHLETLQGAAAGGAEAISPDAGGG